MNKRKQRNIIIIGLSSIVLLMAIGYAAFSTVLNIQGTSKISSTWDVEITGITKDKTKGNVTEISKPTFDKESATFSVGLESPGDYIYYKVAVTNKGTLAAIAKLGNLSCGESNVITCGAYPDSSVSTNIGSNTDLTNQRLIIGPNETEYYNLWIKYKNDVNTQPNKTLSSISLKLTYEQSDVGITHTTEDKCYTGKVLENGTMTITDYDEKCGTDVIIPDTIDGYIVTSIASGKWDAAQGKTVAPFASKNITSVVIPDSILTVGDFAFRDNKILSLTLGSNVRIIGVEAFANNSISSVILPTSLNNIGSLAFASNKLTSIDIPNTVSKLGGGAFVYNMVSEDNAYIYGRNSDGSIDYTTLNSYANRRTSDSKIPSSIKTIGYAAFRYVGGNSLDVPSTVETLDQYSFWQSNLNNIVLNEGLKVIGNNAFRSAFSIKNINIPNSVETIGNNAFELSYLKTITIGNGIQTIGKNAFEYKEVSGGIVYNPITSITINRKEGSVGGSPWGATKAQINWTGIN